MFDIKLDDSELRALAKELPERHKAAAASSLRSVSFELNKAYGAYAKAGPHGPYAPVSVALRKEFKGGYGAWIARYSRYYVDPESLSSIIGIISTDDTGGSNYLRDVPRDGPRGGMNRSLAQKWSVISRGFGRKAKLHASGMQIAIDRKKQRAIAKVLMKKYGRGADWIHGIVPRIGGRQVKPRPIADPVLQQKRAWAVGACRKLYRIKMAGGRYSRDWAKEMTP